MSDIINKFVSAINALKYFTNEKMNKAANV